MSTENFYQNIKPFSNFSYLAEDSHFQAVPSDWLVIVTDVKSSTKAIEEGRYKDVNMIGAASIVAAHNVMKDIVFPYVFGGDGAVFLIPPEYERDMSEKLTALKALSLSKFNLDLRIGSVAVSEILESGLVIEVAKFSPNNHKSIALFRGGGISLAENKVKEDEEKYKMSDSSASKVNLQKLSCRWEPIPSQKGKVITLLISTKKQNDLSTYKKIIRALNHICQGDLDTANPVNDAGLKYKEMSSCYQSEKKLHEPLYSYGFFRRLISIFLSCFIFKYGWFEKYEKSIKTHSDYKKFDDMLRMVIDCTELQAKLINRLLGKLYEKGDIYYGVHESENSLMTCFVESTHDNKHIHFIDGDNGGYAVAAKYLKEQMKADKKENENI